MAKAKYVFITKKGRMFHKSMSPSKATKYGKSKNIKQYGLASMFVYPKRRKK